MELDNLTFKGGYHMHDYKEFSKDCPLEDGPNPKTVYICLHQHIGAPCEPLVKKGDYVKVGQKIGDSGATISAPVHASVSGNVVNIIDVDSSAGMKTKAIEIENDMLYEIGYETYHDDYTQLSHEEISQRIREAGIVGLGGAGFPTSVKLSKKPDQQVDEIIVNGAECEPYLTSDQVAMENYADKIVIGLKICMQRMDAKKGYIGIEDNKPNAIRALKEACKSEKNITVCSLKTKYPQGDDKRLTFAITGKKISKGVRSLSMGVVVINVSSCMSVYDAVCHGIPLTERFISVTGGAIAEPKNIRTKIGTPLKDVLAFCGGFKEEPKKIIVGGPMMGQTQYSIESPTVKTTGGIICMGEKEFVTREMTACIKCGKCVDVCPVGLLPLYLQKHILSGDFEGAEKLYLNDCIECGTCSYICPAARPLVESFRFGKGQLKAQQRQR